MPDRRPSPPPAPADYVLAPRPWRRSPWQIAVGVALVGALVFGFSEVSTASRVFEADAAITERFRNRFCDDAPHTAHPCEQSVRPEVCEALIDDDWAPLLNLSGAERLGRYRAPHGCSARGESNAVRYLGPRP